ncbi:MAG TPA: PLP-dependent aspartate aminotransferase family protein [Chitinophagaceae bacterium]|nr:PLP-dependent aspartate aminotransferase family protein [Chitinophagaceae bacterium]
MNNTQILHSIPVDPLTGSIGTPIYLTSTFVQEAPGINRGFAYGRTGNPTRSILEQLIAQLEGGASGSAFASGLAAIDAVVRLLHSGDEILALDDLYGGAFRLFTQVYNRYDIRVSFADAGDVGAVLDAITPRTKLIWIESPSNPTLKIADIEAIARLARAHGILLCVDNTFASPVLQQPLRLGADIVVHSATKYLGGHSDLIAGLVVTREEALGEQIRFFQNAAGAVLSPFDSWLVIRGIETLSLRVKHQSRTAGILAEALQQHPLIRHVNYPGLTTHPNHEVAARQSSGFGAVLSFALKEDTEAAARLLITSTRRFLLAESLGGVKSLVSHPATMTHKTIPPAQRRAAGVHDSLVRLSVGLEEPEDLLEDLHQALATVYQKIIRKKSIHE